MVANKKVNRRMIAKRSTQMPTWKPTTAGILSIVAGALHLLGWTAAGFFLVISRIENGLNPDRIHLVGFAVRSILVILMIAAIMAIIGGTFALRRKNWGLALAGAVCAIAGPFTGFLGVLATIFLGLSRPEFDQIGEPPPTGPDGIPPDTPPPPPAE
jgi:hypothetical protein